MGWDQLSNFDGTLEGELIYMIHKISQLSDGAGWLKDCEYLIWKEINIPEKTYHGCFNYEISIEEKNLILMLAEKIKGWPVLLKNGPTIIPLDEWKILYKWWPEKP